MKTGKPNTNQPVNNKNPRAIIKELAVRSHICDRCRSRWVEANHVYCDPCDGKIQAYRQQRNRRRFGPKRDVNPRWLSIMLAPDLGTPRQVMAVLTTDVGTLMTVRHLEAADVRSSLKGHATLQTVRAPERKAA